MRKIIFWGASGQAKVLQEALDGRTELVALVDNRLLGDKILGVPLLHGEKELDSWLSQNRSSDELLYAVAVGGARGSERLMLMDILASRGLVAHTVIHKTAFVAQDTHIGEGSQILAQAAVCAGARLGRGVIVNTAASVDHDCEVGDGTHLAPGVHLAGEIRIGERVFVGIGAVILPRITIGEGAVVGAGAVVIRDVPAGVKVVGNPARTIGSINNDVEK